MSSAIVVGAGVFGASTARALARRGWDVTLVEQYTPGSVRSASGGDTRLMRSSHGDVDWYADLAWRARASWLALQEETGTHIFEGVGVAWFAHGEDGFEGRSRRSLERLGIPHEWLSPDEGARLYPSLETSDLAAVLFEPDAGVLYARRATQLLVASGVDAGVQLQTGRVTPADEPRADVVVWACGAWLPALFPHEIDLSLARRDVFFFGGDGSWAGTPGFCDYDAAFYGHGEIAGLGVKVAPDFPDLPIEPDTVDRLARPESLAEARAYAARRFPALAAAPVIGSRVCQYVLSADTHFAFGRHSQHESWWLLGGDSGHGFKHGPALGEYVADCVDGTREPEPFHVLGPRSGDAGLRTAS